MTTDPQTVEHPFERNDFTGLFGGCNRCGLPRPLHRPAAQPIVERLAPPKDARNLAGWIMLKCGVRGMSKEHGQLQTEIEESILALPAAQPQASEPEKCAICGKPATCIGRYEDLEGPEQPACDSCCGHGNEDGKCRPIAPASEPQGGDRLRNLAAALSHLAHDLSKEGKMDEAIVTIRRELESVVRECAKRARGLHQHDCGNLDCDHCEKSILQHWELR